MSKTLIELFNDGIRSERMAMSYWAFIASRTRNGNHKRTFRRIKYDEQEHLETIKRIMKALGMGKLIIDSNCECNKYNGIGKSLPEIIQDGIRYEKEAQRQYIFLLSLLQNGNHRRSINHNLNDEREHQGTLERIKKEIRL